MFATNIVLTLLVGSALGLLIWQHSPAAWGWTQITGISVLAIGFAFWSVARFQLGNSLAITAQAKGLVTHGLYSKIRNPIYVFGSCVGLGLILVLARPVWLLIFLVIVPLQIWRARKEAAVLEAAFGEKYRNYRAGTWF